jgi:ankyrin repeat protein
MVEAILERNADVDIQDENGSTALMAASIKGPVEIVEALLERGAKGDTPDENGNTALMYAINKGHYQIAQSILENGADASLLNSNGSPAVAFFPVLVSVCTKVIRLFIIICWIRKYVVSKLL